MATLVFVVRAALHHVGPGAAAQTQTRVRLRRQPGRGTLRYRSIPDRRDAAPREGGLHRRSGPSRGARGAPGPGGAPGGHAGRADLERGAPERRPLRPAAHDDRAGPDDARARRQRPSAHAAGRTDGLDPVIAAGDRATGRLRGERQRGAEPRKDAHGVRVRRAPPQRLDDDGSAAGPPADRHERGAARESVLHAGRTAAGRAAKPDGQLRMSSSSSSGLSAEGRLQRCIRDLAALNALPSVCIGRAPDEALEIALDALPTALGCELSHLRLAGPTPREKGTFQGTPLNAAQLDQLRAATAADADGIDAQLFLDGRKLWCLEVEIPIGPQRGRLFVGRGAPLDAETDRVLVRTAANVVGTILETANVLDVARRKDDFLALLGHELRNPLAPITTAVELLARHPNAVRERTVIERHTRHLVRLVDDLLDISRVTRGHIELRKEQVSLGAVLAQAVEIASPLVARTRHRLQVCTVEGVILQGAPVRLAQVFGNLLPTAATFTPPGGTIEVQVERLRTRVQVTVRDAGRGIARDQLQRIFEPFVQADRERDAVRGGLGLGLAIVKDLVHRHGGTVTASSEGPGKGAAFTVELPIMAQLEPAKESAPPRPSSRRPAMAVPPIDVAPPTPASTATS